MPSREEEVKAWEAVDARTKVRRQKAREHREAARRIYANQKRYLYQQNRPTGNALLSRTEADLPANMYMTYGVLREYDKAHNLEAMNHADYQIQATKSAYPESAPMIDKLLRAAGFDVTETKRR